MKALRDHVDAARSPQATDHDDVLHDGKIGKAPAGPEAGRPEKQPLIAIGKTQPAGSQVGPFLDEPQPRGIGIDAQGKSPARHIVVLEGAAYDARIPPRKPAVGVQKEEEIPPGQGCAPVHLARPAGRAPA